MIDVVRLNVDGLQRLSILYDIKNVKFLVGGDWAIIPISENIGAIGLLRPTPGNKSWGEVKTTLDQWKRIWGTIIFTRWEEGKPVSMREADYELVNTRLRIKNEVFSATG